MKSLLVFVLVSLVAASLLSNSVHCRRQQVNSEEDEFSEFDTISDEEEVSGDNKPRKKYDEPKLVKEARAADFASFDDETIESEGDDEDFEDPNESDDFKRNNFDKKPKPDDLKAKLDADESKKPKTFSGFNINNPDDLDMEEFEHFVDEEEFEGFESTPKTPETKEASKKKQPGKQADANKMPSLKIADVPMHLMSNGNWSNYVWEIVMLFLIGIYFMNFLYGKSKNYRLVTAWYQSHRELLERNFSVVGDDGNSIELPGQKPHTELSSYEPGILIKDSENSYGLWCTGRQMCDGKLQSFA